MTLALAITATAVSFTCLAIIGRRNWHDRRARGGDITDRIQTSLGRRRS